MNMICIYYILQKLHTYLEQFFYVFYQTSVFLRNTKFEKNLPHGFDKSADLLSKHQNHEEDFFSNYVCFSKSPNFMQGMKKKMADCSELILYKHTTALNYERRQDKHVFHNSSLFKDFCKRFCKDFLVEREIYVRSFIVLQGRRYTGGGGERVSLLFLINRPYPV